jgi:hypothetical protein
MSFFVQSVTSLAKEGLCRGVEGEDSRESLFRKANKILEALLAGLVRK